MPRIRKIPKTALTIDQIQSGDIFVGDCLTFMEEKFPWESVDLIFTSPPYNTHKKDMYDSYVDDLPYEEYLDFLENFVRKTIFLLKPGAHLIINLPLGIGRVPYEPYFCSLIERVRKNTFYKYYNLIFRGFKFWFKGHAGGKSIAVGSIANKPSVNDDLEVLLIYRKGRRDRNGKTGDSPTKEFKRDMNHSWFIRPATTNEERFGHNAVMPIELAEKVIQYWTRPGEIILDPFAGTGTTMFAAMKWSRKAWGIEISENYCEIIRKRLQSIPQPLDQFLEESEEISTNISTKGGKNFANRTKL